MEAHGRLRASGEHWLLHQGRSLDVAWMAERRMFLVLALDARAVGRCILQAPQPGRAWPRWYTACRCKIEADVAHWRNIRPRNQQLHAKLDGCLHCTRVCTGNHKRQRRQNDGRLLENSPLATNMNHGLQNTRNRKEKNRLLVGWTWVRREQCETCSMKKQPFQVGRVDSVRAHNQRA